MKMKRDFYFSRLSSRVWLVSYQRWRHCCSAVRNWGKWSKISFAFYGFESFAICVVTLWFIRDCFIILMACLWLICKKQAMFAFFLLVYIIITIFSCYLTEGTPCTLLLFYFIFYFYFNKVFFIRRFFFPYLIYLNKFFISISMYSLLVC